jgi:gliding motility-associated-like protein
MKKLNTKLLRSFLLLLLLPATLTAQNFSNYNWYFGNSPQGVRFSRSNNTASLVSTTVPLNTGGSAVASDQINGDLLFYTDGTTLYDVTNAVMPNGTGLNGAPVGNQPVAVAKVPGQLNQFYVITNSATFGSPGSIAYRIVDMSLFGNAVFPAPALGDATTNTNTTIAGLATNRSEAMIVIPHDNGDDFWLVTHANGSPDYSVTLVTTTGPSTTTTFTGLGLINDAVNFAYHAGTNRIAVSPQEGTRDAEILNFDPATGALSFQQRILNSGVPTATTTPSIYDMEFSPNGDLVYLSRTGEPGVQADVLQFDLNGGATVSLASVLPAPNTIAQSYGLQIGPDSAIYHLYQATANGPFLLGKITDADSLAPKALYTAQAFPGNINFKGKQFPSFAPRDTVDLKVTFTADGLCANSPTSFYPTVTPSADSLSWDLGDGTGKSHDWSPVYTYPKDGTYPVTVTAYLNGQKATYTAPVTITPFDTQINLVQDTTACSCELPVQKAVPPKPSCGRVFKVTAKVNGSGSPQLQWFGPGGLIPGATTATLAPDSAGYYYLVATVGGCSTYAGVNIKEYDVQDQRANIWFFGKNAGLDFNPPNPNNPTPPPVPNPIKNNVMDAPAGTSTISDRNGQVVLFTNGKSVWNRQEQLLSSDIGGDSLSAQAALIIPVPGDETLYYIFTTKDVYGDGTFELRYALFDLKLNNGTGGIVDPDGNPATPPSTLLFAKSTERITGNANWLIAHEYGNNSFRAYKITQQGIGNPVISSIGSDHNFATAANGQGYMKLGAKNRLAVALSTPGVSNVVEVFDFADSSGTVSNFRSADLKNGNGQVYGVELSAGGNKLFATLQGTGSSQIAEFAFDSLGIPYLKKPPIAPVGQKLGAIQTAPNGQVYVAAEGDTKLGVITVNEDTTAVSQFQPSKQDLLAGTNSRLGLPNFIQNLGNPTQGPGLAVNGSCVQDSISFVGTPTDPIDSLGWTLLQGATVLKSLKNQQAFKYLFAAPGKYQVKLHLTNRCGLDTLLTQDFEIFGAPPDPSTAVVLCNGPIAIDANPNDLPDLTYAWSTGAVTETITVNKKALYKVTVTNKAGCTTDGQILASDSRPILELGPNTTICEGTSIGTLDAQNPGMTYAWTINGTPAGTAAQIAVNTSVPSPPSYEYEVTVTDPINTCFSKDSVIYTINAKPVIGGPNTVAPTSCGTPDGKIINLSITGPAAGLFSYFITGPSTSISDTDLSVGAIPDATGLAAGTYGITVADQVTGCATNTTASINDNAFSLVATQVGTCNPNIALSVDVTATPGPLTFPLTYRVIDQATLAVVETNTAGTEPFSTGPVPANSFTPTQYTVEVTSGGCKAGFNAQVLQNPTASITGFTSDVCAEPMTVQVQGGTSWLWSGPDITSATTVNPITIGPPAGVQTYKVKVSQAGVCDLDTAVTVTVAPAFTANYTHTDACADQVTLTATPDGAYTYFWYINDVLQSQLGGTQVVVPKANDGAVYKLEVRNAAGCKKTFTDQPIQVDGTLTVALTGTLACVGTPFTLTAVPSRSSVVAWAFNGTTIPNQSGGTLQDTRSGKYTVTASEASCQATADMDVTVNPSTPGYMKDEALICPEPENPDPNTRQVVLDPGEFTSYAWYKNDITLDITTPTLTVDELGLYSVKLVNEFGCSSSDKTQVKEQCDPVIVGPNAFRPTSVIQGQAGDYVNQAFMLFTFFIDDQNFQVFIFNRWGEMIYQSNQRDFKWNGGYNNNAGQQAPPGTYTYLVRYQSSYRPEKGVQEKRGGVVLLR